ncbi:MAG: rhodanese-like domain-containing protein [Gemmatimonadota bacterium]|nr:rhodanese-like domain-containing protein [Gemmatimonadota bacterium]
MIIRRFYDDPLAQASYLIGCGREGVAIVIDPNRDVAPYVEAAAAERLRITHVTETHIHADFLSGARDLARITGATLHLSAEGGRDWQYAYAAHDGARLLRDGDVMLVGNVRIAAVHTPGHTPEHLSFLVTDTAAADQPIGIVTGDFVFVGDVGRPDLLERAARVEGTMEASARTLFRSLRKFTQYPDWLQVWPGHGAGSACGKGLSAVPHSTVGYERRFNWAFGVEAEDAFVQAVLEGQPEPPTYFATMKRLNRDGPAPYDPARAPERVTRAQLADAKRAQAFVLDTRRADAFAAGHVPGSISVPLNRSFTSYAGWVVPYDRDVVLIAQDDGAAREAVRALAMIGVDQVAGWASAGVVDEWRKEGGPLGVVAQVDAADLAAALAADTSAVVDVRGRAEWDESRIAGAPNIPFGLIGDRADELPAAGTVVLQCQSGSRSGIAASVLLARGVKNVANLAGGIEEWERAGLPVERGVPASR